MQEIKTRKQAADDGDHKYFTGRPCIHGHLGPRYTTSGICCACNVAAASRYNKQMQKRVNARLQGHFTYPAHPDDHAALLAYAQALDMQRGRAPYLPDVAPPPLPAPLPADLARHRETLAASFTPSLPAYLPKP